MSEVSAEQLSSGDRGSGEQRVVLAPSAEALEEEIGVEVPEAGEGVYLAAFWGRKTTGGYSVAVESAGIEGGEVTVRLALEEPPEDAVVAQVITYPYAVAVVRGANMEQSFSFVAGDVREIGWPVRRSGG